ncbi:HU family DNA-binding protein [Prevotella copri]|uniref:HU family DNA-binding protein n=1 Tax=Segatella copri TaxID=165179 RepID=UPI001C38DD9B|nr:HU family DNA-binding protein [Segatella copri]MBV3401323.1 HU family DNA-binding protein [Segatella copri]
MSKNSLNGLADKLAEKSGLSQIEAELFIRKMFDVCHQGLAADKIVKMRWLGTFKVTSVKERESVDVNTGERIVIEGRDKISFTPDNILKEIVNKPFAQFETVIVNDGVDFESIDKKYEDSLEDEEQEESLEKPKPIIEVVEPTETPLPDVVSEETTQAEAFSSSEPTTSGVIDFLDVPENPSEDSSVVVVGEDSTIEPQTTVSLKVPTDEIPSSVSDDIQADSREENSNAEIEAETDAEIGADAKIEAETDAEIEADDEVEIRRRHFIIPKYVVIIASFTLLLLIGGLGWFAFNYGQMAAQRDHLELQLAQYKTDKNVVAKPANVKSQEQLLQEKARQDSLRMAKANDAIKAAERADSLKSAAVDKEISVKNLKADEKSAELKKKSAIDKKQDKAAEHAKVVSDKYDSDPRVRTGAYRIVGVDQVVTVGEHQTMATLSKRYLGPGMECYIEALNGTSTIKSGQKVKIPKLELKKKKAK